MIKVFDIKARYAFRKDSTENWERKNPVLADGEPSIATDKLTDGSGEWLKIGDGQNYWKDLPWAKGPQGIQGEKGEKGDTGEQGPQGIVDYTLVANAIKGNRSGFKVNITDASPFQHYAKVQLSSHPIVNLAESLFGTASITAIGEYGIEKPSNITEILKTNTKYTLKFAFKISEGAYTFGSGYSEIHDARIGFRMLDNVDGSDNVIAHFDYTDIIGAILNGDYADQWIGCSVDFTTPNADFSSDAYNAIYWSTAPLVLSEDGSYAGLICEIKDIELTEELDTSIGMDDYSGIKLIKRGKNLFDVNKITSVTNLIKNDDGTLTVYGAAITSQKEFSYLCPDLKVGDKITVSLRVTNALEDTKTLTYMYITGGGANYTLTSGSYYTVTQEMLDGMVYFYCRTYGTNVDDTPYGIVSEIQIELGSIATDYELYKRAEYTPTVEGAIENILVIYPTMILETDTPGIVINCEYNKDINKEIGNIEALLGGI